MTITSEASQPATGPKNHTDTRPDSARVQELKEAHRGAAAGLQQMVERAEDLARAGRDTLSAGSHELSESALRVGNRTLDYIRHEPVKAVAIAALMGAAAVALAHLMRHPPASR